MTITSHIPSVEVATAAPTLSKTHIVRLEAAGRELARLDAMLVQTTELKEMFATLGQDFAAGKIDFIPAATLLCTKPTDRDEIAGRMRSHIKARIRQTIEAVTDIIHLGREASVADLLARCAQMEKSERQTLAEAGLDGDLYEPSRVLLRLRETHLRALRQLKTTPTRGDLRLLLEACAIAAPGAAELC